MSTPTISYLLLDAGNDPVFDPNAALTNAAAVAQAVETRLRLFLGEWWEDLSLGLPVFQVILGQLGTQQGQTAMNLVIQQQILGVPYVVSVQNVTSSFVAGKFSYTAQFTTQFGPVSVTSLPGSSAGLGA